MREFLNILEDIRTGALPASEIPGFVAWMVMKSNWFWIAVSVAILALFVRRKSAPGQTGS